MDLEPKAVRSRVGLPVLAERREPARPLGYYDIPFLKRPTWEWHISTYFFLEAVSSGAFLLAAVADAAGRERFDRVRRAGYLLSFAAFLPCPPLLIADLGRPERFHHMLRIFKPTSAMSHGSWALLAYSVPMTVMAAEVGLEAAPRWMGLAERIERLLPTPALGVAGIPCAMMLATYPGVLLSTTANPLWSTGRGLGALFAAGSIHAGAAAVSAALAVWGSHTDEQARLERIERVAAAAEAAALAVFVATAGRHAAPLVSGRYRTLFWVGAVGAGLVAPLVVEALAPKRGWLGRVARVAASALALAGAFALKWAVTHAGAEAAADARASHAAAIRHGTGSGSDRVDRAR
jgi:formate-dependent nitrite reductase membrane component NrfD